MRGSASEVKRPIETPAGACKVNENAQESLLGEMCGDAA